MKQVFIAICFLILCATLTEATNNTNITNTSIPTNSSSNATQLTALYIGAFFDLSKKDGYGSLPMAQQAMEEINNNTELLPGYRLELVVKSTEVSYRNIYCIGNPYVRFPFWWKYFRDSNCLIFRAESQSLFFFLGKYESVSYAGRRSSSRACYWAIKSLLFWIKRITINVTFIRW